MRNSVICRTSQNSRRKTTGIPNEDSKGTVWFLAFDSEKSIFNGKVAAAESVNIHFPKRRNPSVSSQVESP